jgi:Polyketide cyclase / dehydrase and lipid transport
MAKSSNQAFSYEVETAAPASQIWALWMDVSRWEEWDLGLSAAELNGPMALGTIGTIIDLGGRRSKFRISEMSEGQSYTFVTKLPFGYLNVKRLIVRTDPCTFRHDVSFTGPGGWLLSHLLGPTFRKQLPPTMDKLAALAERTSGTEA